MRLQLEIIQKSDDESIFAWTNPDSKYGEDGMLARWPTWFAGCGNIKTGKFSPRAPYSMTNKGLEFRIPDYTLGPDPLKVALDCYRKFHGGVHRATIKLRMYHNFGYRYDDAGAEFDDYIESPVQDIIAIRDIIDMKDSNTHVIYLPQEGRFFP